MVHHGRKRWRRQGRLGGRSRRLVGHTVLTLETESKQEVGADNKAPRSIPQDPFSPVSLNYKTFHSLAKGQHQETPRHFTWTIVPMQIWFYTGSVLKGETSRRGSSRYWFWLKCPTFIHLAYCEKGHSQGRLWPLSFISMWAKSHLR